MGGDRTLLGIRFILLRSFASYWNRCGCGGLSGIARRIVESHVKLPLEPHVKTSRGHTEGVRRNTLRPVDNYSRRAKARSDRGNDHSAPLKTREMRGYLEVLKDCTLIALRTWNRSKILRESLKITLESHTRKISLRPQKKSERARNNPPENR